MEKYAIYRRLEGPLFPVPESNETKLTRSQKRDRRTAGAEIEFDRKAAFSPGGGKLPAVFLLDDPVVSVHGDVERRHAPIAQGPGDLPPSRLIGCIEFLNLRDRRAGRNDDDGQLGDHPSVEVDTAFPGLDGDLAALDRPFQEGDEYGRKFLARPVIDILRIGSIDYANVNGGICSSIWKNNKSDNRFYGVFDRKTISIL